MAAVQCIKCTAERRGFRRELDSWRHKLIHCIGFESILEGIYGPLLLRDLNLFADCEPEEVDDWSPDGSCSQCSFCHLSLDKLGDQVPAASPPLSSPSEYSPCQASTTIESLSAHRFLQAVFHKKDVPSSCDSNIPLIAQELMKKMIHQFALEYASECLLQSSANGVTRTSSPMSEASDAPLDLTVSRAHEGKESEPEPDGVLDLSNRNSACSTTSSSSSSSSSSNLKASGSPPSSSLTEEQRDQVQRRTTFRCAMDAVLGSLCRAHRSLLYQILKLAHQEKLLTFVNHKQTESHCCHSGIKPQAAPHLVPFSQCKPRNCNQCFATAICDHQAVSSTVCHPRHCKSTCSSHDCHSKDCDGDTRHNVSYSYVHMCRVGESTAGCSERMHCNSCHSSAAGHNIMCSFAPAPLLCAPSNLCPTLSIGSNCHNGHSSSCSTNKVGLTQVRSSTRKELGDGDPPCPVLKREQSPSPPPLSPIPSDIDKKTDEKPPSLLHHRQDEQTELGIEISRAKMSRQETDVDFCTADESQRETSKSDQAEKNQSGTSLQDVVNRFSEKLDTIRPLDKDPALATAGICVSGKEKLPFPSTSRSLQFNTDAHLTEIITTVLHTGRASDYNLSELFNRHDNGEPKSPNTRSRRRQEVLAAIATPADDASTRRHTLQIKREFARLDPSCSKRRVAGSKKSRLKQGNVSVSHPSPDPDEVKDVSKEETKVGVLAIANDKVKEGIPDSLPTESNSDDVKEEIQTVIITEDFQTVKAEAKEREISSDEKEFAFSDSPMPTPELQCNGKQDSKDKGGDTGEISGTLYSTQRCGSPRKSQVDVNSAVRDKKLVNSSSVDISETVNKAGRIKKYRNQVKRKKYQLNRSEEARKSGRSIVLPQRFSSYVTEPRKMFFVACFSEKIFNREAQKDSDLTPNMLHAPSKDPDIKDAQLVSRSEEDSSLSEDPEKRPIEASQKQHGPTSTKPTNEVQIPPPTVGEEQRPEKDSSDNTTGSDCDVTPVKKLRSSPRRPRPLLMSSSPSDKDSSVTSGARVENPSTFQIQYTSPIKLMFVSPVMDEGGVRYSLKSASSGSGIQAEHFDPFEESSWSGAPQKHNSPIKEPAPSREKSVSSPLKSATSRTRSASSSPKSASSSPKSASSPGKLVSPAKSASSPPKTASSPRSTTSPKIGSRRSGESTPTKRIAGSESQGSPGDLACVHETTPPKRRPGRPKKLGPQLEQKVKRPIGRPRKEKPVDPVKEAKTTGKDLPSPDEENVNKNLKITVMYGRSRRNKRTVSEGFDQLQTEFSDACKAVGLKSDFGILLDNSSTNSDCIKASEELNFITPAKELSLQSSSNIKCQKRDDSVPSRKPGRPAKVKISGISVTITTVSPRQRKIQINKDYLRPSKTTAHKKALLPHFKSAKEPRTISSHSPSKITPAEEVIGTENESQDRLSKKPVAVRHSMRVRKPSIHFLRAVATSGFKSYSRSNALLRRSKQLLLSKASNERRQEGLQRSVETSREDKPLSRREGRSCSQDIGKVAGVSVSSIFTPKETIRWWAPSAEQQTMNQELARRIRVISDTWVSDSVENKETTLNPKLGSKGKSCVTGKSKQSSVVRTLFDCSPDKPRSCSMQQICSWFMQTTETQSLSIVKKTSSRHTYDPVQFSRSANKISVCSSPQAERLRRHIKKFAKAVPKTPSQHREAQRRLRKKIEARLSTRNVKRQLFTHNFSKGKANQRVQLWRSREKGHFQAILMRARTRFLTKRERLGWQKKQNKKNIKVPAPFSRGRAATLQPERKALRRSAEDDSNCLGSSSAIDSAEQTREPVDVCKELNLCSKAWSPETLKECRVFLRKINSPDNESTEEEWDSCTVTLDNGSHSACLFAGRGRELVKVVKAVKTERKQRLSRRTASTELAASAPPSILKPDDTSLKRQRGKHKSPEVASAEPSQSPPAKMLRQSRVRGLTGPKWSDFVFES